MKAFARDIARAWLPRAVVIALTLLLMLLIPKAFVLPVPEGAVELRDARVQLPGRAAQTISLPHRWPQDVGAGPAAATYSITLPALPPEEPHVLLIPTARLTLTARLDGIPLQRDTPPPTQEIAGFAVMVRLPPGAVSAGGRSLEITLAREWGITPGYLSPVYLAAESDLGNDRWRWTMGDGIMSTVALAVHALIVFAVTIVWTARRRDPIFGWLFVLGAASFLNTVPGWSMAPAWLAWIRPYGTPVAAGVGLSMAALALSIIGLRRPLWLKAGVFGLPALLIVLTVSGVLPAPVSVMAGALAVVGGSLAAGVLLLGGANRPADWDRLFLAAPFLLTACFALRDLGVVLGLVQGGVLLTYHTRTLIIVAVLALLMRRLARTLHALDTANETQRRTLHEQEAELSRLHREEQRRMAQAAREEERQRLMRDLHDGLSGHLVSIIALSERDSSDRRAVEKAARAALEDLRLVINSLDLDDGDLRLALAGFHERLAPQLRRIGVALDWSMEDLPEIGGVTPANALSILRILQEAVTNALKHGPARRIEIRGARGPDGAAVVTVWNDAGGPSRRGAGRGLDNMRRRAHGLGGGIQLEKGDDHALMTLILPARLAEG